MGLTEVTFLEMSQVNYLMKLMKIRPFRALALITCLAALLGTAYSEIRTFTSSDGRSVDAEIVGATAEDVTLKLAAGQTLATPLSRFSLEDQKFIAAWRKQNPVKINYSFQASYTKEKTDSMKAKRGSETITTETWVCKMKVANRSGQTLENVKLDYSVFYNQMDMGKPVLRRSNGSVTIPKIRGNEELVLPTGEVKLNSVQLEGGYYYTDGSRARQKDALAGMTISFKHEGREVFTWASQGMEGKTGTASGTQGSLSQ